MPEPPEPLGEGVFEVAWLGVFVGGAVEGLGEAGVWLARGAGAAVFGVTAFGVAVFGVAVLGVAVFGVAVFGVDTLGVDTLGVDTLGTEGTRGTTTGGDE